MVYSLHLKFFQVELVNPVAFIFGMFSSNLFLCIVNTLYHESVWLIIKILFWLFLELTKHFLRKELSSL